MLRSPLDVHVINNLLQRFFISTDRRNIVYQYACLRVFGSSVTCFRLITWSAFKIIEFRSSTNWFCVCPSHCLLRCIQSLNNNRLTELNRPVRFQCKGYRQHFHHCNSETIQALPRQLTRPNSHQPSRSLLKRFTHQLVHTLSTSQALAFIMSAKRPFSLQAYAHSHRTVRGDSAIETPQKRDRAASHR